MTLLAGNLLANGVKLNSSNWTPGSEAVTIGAEPRSAVPVEFYYQNLSGFHGNGEALWVSEDGLIVAQIVGREPYSKSDCTYRFRLGEEDSRRLLVQLTALASGPLAVNDFALNRTDPVRVFFGIRDAAKRLREFEIWDHDWDRQPRPVQNLKRIVEQIILLTKKLKPVAMREIRHGGEIRRWPNEFLPLPGR